MLCRVVGLQFGLQNPFKPDSRATMTRSCAPLHLARLDVRVSAWTARWRDHFLLMASLRVRDFRVNALIPYRRGRNHAFMLGWGRGPLLLVGSGWVVALRDGLLNHIVPITA